MCDDLTRGNAIENHPQLDQWGNASDSHSQLDLDAHWNHSKVSIFPTILTDRIVCYGGGEKNSGHARENYIYLRGTKVNKITGVKYKIKRVPIVLHKYHSSVLLSYFINIPIVDINNVVYNIL